MTWIFNTTVILTVTLLAAGQDILHAQSLSVAPIFSDHMVLQRNLEVPIWGTGKPGALVEVALGEITSQDTVDADGKWELRLPEMDAGGPFELKIVSKRTILLRDVFIGEVWLCSGQSNMAFPLNRSIDGHDGMQKGALHNIRIHQFREQINLQQSLLQRRDIKRLNKKKLMRTATWKIAQGQDLAFFSAVAFHFGLAIADSLDVAVGLIQNAIGGTPTQSWISRQKILSHPQLKHLLEEDSEHGWYTASNVNPWLVEKVKETMALDVSRRPDQTILNHPYAPAYMFETGIKPILSYGIRGVIWYQGESNATHPESHDLLFTTLVEDWRSQWGQGSFPFFYVQLPGISNRTRWPEFRESQFRCEQLLENTAMAITTDLGDPRDVHPKNKSEVGQRLARLALSKTYAKPIIPSGPKLVHYEVDRHHNLMKTTFSENTGSLQLIDTDSIRGLTAHGFNMEGTMEQIESIEKIIINQNKMTIQLPQNMQVTEIKYNWLPLPIGNLVNDEGLPVAPFKIELPGRQ